MSVPKVQRGNTVRLCSVVDAVQDGGLARTIRARRCRHPGFHLMWRDEDVRAAVRPSWLRSRSAAISTRSNECAASVERNDHAVHVVHTDAENRMITPETRF